MNWRDVPMPERIAKLPRDARGFPVPFVVLRDKNGVPMFAANDSDKAARAVALNWCAICGKPMGKDRWMAGGPGSAFQERGPA